MYRLAKGPILPGIGIGIFSLGMTYNDICKIFEDFLIEDRYRTFVIIGEDIQIWVDKDSDVVIQIMVYDTFQGKYDDQIGIGSKLTEALEMGKTYHEELDTFVLDDEPGMCFELGDTPEEDDWDELRAPIAYISVFVPRAEGLLNE